MAEVRKSKQLLFGTEVQKKILNGTRIVAQAVGATLGSKGGNVAYELGWGIPMILHDGVSVAKQIVLEDPFENMAAQMIITAAQNTNTQAGDGTTTATILTHGIVSRAFEIMAGGATNAQVIRRGIDVAVAALTVELDRMATPIETKEQMIEIATISAADPLMGKQIAEAVHKVGKSGVVSVQEGGPNGVTVEYKRGMEFSQGIASSAMMTDLARQEGVLTRTPVADGAEPINDSPYVVIVNEKLMNDKLVKLLESALTINPRSQFLFIADDYDMSSAQTLVKTAMAGKIRLIATKSPEFGKQRENILEDIAILTGGKVLGGAAGIALDNAKVEDFGRCDQVVSGAEQTIVIDGHGAQARRDEHIEGLRLKQTASKDVFEKDKYDTRLAKLVGGVAVVSVSAASETETRELKERIYDAVNATKAAVDEGVVPGGGVALLRAREVLGKLAVGKNRLGVEVVSRALEEPMKKLITNSGEENYGYVMGKVEADTNPNTGYNVETSEICDMLKAGIVDPVKVTKSALKNAASVSNMLLTTQCMIAFNRQELTNEERGQELDGTGPLV